MALFHYILFISNCDHGTNFRFNTFVHYWELAVIELLFNSLSEFWNIPYFTIVWEKSNYSWPYLITILHVEKTVQLLLSSTNMRNSWLTSPWRHIKSFELNYTVTKIWILHYINIVFWIWDLLYVGIPYSLGIIIYYNLSVH